MAFSKSLWSFSAVDSSYIDVKCLILPGKAYHRMDQSEVELDTCEQGRMEWQSCSTMLLAKFEQSLSGVMNLLLF